MAESNAHGFAFSTIDGGPLPLAQFGGKPVLVVEYPRNDEQAKAARREISEQGFIGLTTRRSLNAL